MSALVTGGWPEDPKPLSREEIERRERAFFNPAPSRRQSRDVDMYCLPLQGGRAKPTRTLQIQFWIR